MLDFFKKLVGLPTTAEKVAAEQAAQAPYKIEKPEDQLPPVKFPVDGGVKAFQPKAPKNAARKPKVAAPVKTNNTKSKPKSKKAKK